MEDGRKVVRMDRVFNRSISPGAAPRANLNDSLVGSCQRPDPDSKLGREEGKEWKYGRRGMPKSAIGTSDCRPRRYIHGRKGIADFPRVVGKIAAHHWDMRIHLPARTGTERGLPGRASASEYM